MHLYQGDQWPDQPEMLALVCDVGGNLVHRKRLDDNGLWKIGRRIDKETEFLRSTDTWFRPVQLGGGPSGGLYVADMYREVIEHPASLPPLIKSQVDLNSGNDRGRIWRVVADSVPVRRETPRLDKLPSEELVELLRHPNHWQRRTAARLLVEREATEAIASLQQFAASDAPAAGRLDALDVLQMFPGAAVTTAGPAPPGNICSTASASSRPAAGASLAASCCSGAIASSLANRWA